MPINLEIKARISDPKSAMKIARSINAQRVGSLDQKDTYYQVLHGRLKLRQHGNGRSELIFYNRREKSYQRKSKFQIYPLDDSAQLHDLLRQALGVVGVVEKKRRLFLFKGTRIHIDDVKELGSFLEFEAPVKSDLTSAKNALNFLIDKFHIHQQDFITGSYIDYLLKKKGRKLNRCTK